MATASVVDVEDARGFTTAGDDHRFDPKSPDRTSKIRGRGWTFGGRKKRHIRTLSMPVAPADLDLEETLKAKRSFLSPVTSGDESSSSAGNSRSGSGSRRKKNDALATREDSESESVSSVVSTAPENRLLCVHALLL